MDNTLHVLVSKLLNCQNEQVSDKDTKLDVLAILANLVSTTPIARAAKHMTLVRQCLRIVPGTLCVVNLVWAGRHHT